MNSQSQSFRNIIAGLAIALIAGSLGYYFGGNSGKQPIKPNEGGSYMLSYAQARKYVNNYADRAGFVKKYHQGDSVYVRNPRYIWFPAWRLQQLLNQVPDETGGIRFYFASYDETYPNLPAGSQEKNPDSTFWGRNTMVIISTFDTLGVHMDFTPEGGGVRNGKGFLIDAAAYENNGEMCPPPSNCLDKGALLLDDKSVPLPTRKS
ncbi:hypothetical protein CLV59_11026 [Chitinophaga dinghuensis]|uniref:Uncharacterized protein n=1 Tax=Chitinophaga dinghuensis TaxID=1539050 RepID=A0A327VJU3_9BACT|nr:hypothetical protein [Chitinophaga dinghuensis]RAJ74980.1 hypothetical protein CLV59_11026 [Chitinophaga dinghuensis]